MKRLAAIIVLTSVIITALPPKSARAAVPVIDPKLIAAVTKGFALETGETIFGFLAQLTFDKLVDEFISVTLETIKRQILDQMLREIIFWVAGQGKPRFVTDFQGFIKDAAGAGIVETLKALGLEGLCQPLQLSLYDLKLRFSYAYSASCPILGINVNYFKSFEVGGWGGLLATHLPGVNYYVDSLSIERRTIEQGLDKAYAAQLEVSAGGGYESAKKCELVSGTLRCRIVVPGSNIQGVIDRVIASPIDYIVNSNAKDLSALASALIAITVSRMIQGDLFK